jgi:hypothetical protein
MRVPGSVLTHPGQDRAGGAAVRFVRKAEADIAGRLHDIMEPLSTVEAGSRQTSDPHPADDASAPARLTVRWAVGHSAPQRRAPGPGRGRSTAPSAHTSPGPTAPTPTTGPTHGAVGPVRPRPGHLPSQHRDLVMEHQQLSVLGGRTPRQQHQPPQHLAEPRVQHSLGHAAIIVARWRLRRTRSSAPTIDFLAPTGRRRSAATASGPARLCRDRRRRPRPRTRSRARARHR